VSCCSVSSAEAKARLEELTPIFAPLGSQTGYAESLTRKRDRLMAVDAPA
jgi:hypothetical protein